MNEADYMDYLRKEYFDDLYSLETNSPDYCLAQGALYDELPEDERVSEKDAMDVARMINRGEVKKAEQLVEEYLED